MRDWHRWETSMREGYVVNICINVCTDQMIQLEK